MLLFQLLFYNPNPTQLTLLQTTLYLYVYHNLNNVSLILVEVANVLIDVSSAKVPSSTHTNPSVTLSIAAKFMPAEQPPQQQMMMPNYAMMPPQAPPAPAAAAPAALADTQHNTNEHIN